MYLLNSTYFSFLSYPCYTFFWKTLFVQVAEYFLWLISQRLIVMIPYSKTQRCSTRLLYILKNTFWMAVNHRIKFHEAVTNF